MDLRSNAALLNAHPKIIQLFHVVFRHNATWRRPTYGAAGSEVANPQKLPFFLQASNQTVYRGEGGERTVYLLPGEPVTLICQGERDVLWSKDGQVSEVSRKK